jgi:hypothetical protein
MRHAFSTRVMFESSFEAMILLIFYNAKARIFVNSEGSLILLAQKFTFWVKNHFYSDFRAFYFLVQ